MDWLNKSLSNVNFKKLTKYYLITLVLVAIVSMGTIFYISKDKIIVAANYNNIIRSFKHKGFDNTLKEEMNKLGSSSNDIVNIICLDKDDNIIYKYNKNLVLENNKFSFSQYDNMKRYLKDNINNNVIYKVVREENFILNADYIRNHEKIFNEIDDELFYEKDFSLQNIYLLNYEVNKDTKEKFLIIRNAVPILYAKPTLEIISGILSIAFIIYWIGFALWVYKDALERRNNPALWGILTLITNLIGGIIYVMYKFNNKVCFKCGSLQNKDNIFCSVCGTQINDKCNSCGSPTEKGNTFCGRCGNKL